MTLTVGLLAIAMRDAPRSSHFFTVPNFIFASLKVFGNPSRGNTSNRVAECELSGTQHDGEKMSRVGGLMF